MLKIGLRSVVHQGYLIEVQAYFGDIVDLVPDHHNKVNIIIRQVE